MKINNMITISSRFLLAAVILFAALSCKNENLIRRGDDLQTAFNKSMRLFENEEYRDAAEAFETVLEIGRGTDFGQQAQYYLAESYFKDERYLMAASEYERYVSLYPRTDKRKDAQYKEGLSYYNLSPRYKLDQKYTHKAIEKFRLFNSRYSGTDQSDKAAQYISEMRKKLAHKLYNAAQLYMVTDSYQAAITYYDLTIDQYPETTWTQRSLVDKIKAYNVYAGRSVQSKQKERYQKAVDAYETFIQLFPNGEYRTEADEHVDKARAALADISDSNTQADSTTASVDGASE